MGSTVSSNISRVDVSKSPNGKEQCVVYSTPDSRTSTLRASVGVDSASVTLRDYTFDREGTRVEIRVGDVEIDKGGGIDVGTVNCKYWGSVLAVRTDTGKFNILYGIVNVRCGLIVATKHVTNTHGSTLFVAHVYSSQQGYSVTVVEVWYDAAKATFMCNITGPSQHSSFVEAFVAIKRAYGDVVDDPHSTGQQSINTRLINNTGGPFYGHLNGSMISDSMINFINIFMNNM